MNNNVIAHIAGPTGSGKTTLGGRLKDKYPFILVKDIDEIYRDLPAIFRKAYIGSENKKDFYGKYLAKGINKFVSDNKNSLIIFVGFNGFNNSSESFKNIQYIDINAKNNFYIDISVEENLKRRFNRAVNNLNSKRDFYFDKIKNVKPFNIDFKRWTKKIKSNDVSYYKKNQYKFLANEQIYKQMKQIIKKYI